MIVVGIDPGANKAKRNFAIAVRTGNVVFLRSLCNPKAKDIAAAFDSMGICAAPPGQEPIFAAVEDQYLDKNAATALKLRGAAERARTVIELRWPAAVIRPVAAMTWHYAMLRQAGDGKANLPREDWEVRTRIVGLDIAAKAKVLDLGGPRRKLTEDELTALCIMEWMRGEYR